MILEEFAQIVTADYAGGAIINDDYDGFREDYLVLHCLMRRHEPARIMEVGTHLGVGTKILCNAVPTAHVMTLDLSNEESEKSAQHPDFRGRGDIVGSRCDLPHEQIFGDSLTYDFSQKYPIDAWFIDGEHDYNHVFREACAAIESQAQLIVFHDADLVAVVRGITEAFREASHYQLHRVNKTRIAYATRN